MEAFEQFAFVFVVNAIWQVALVAGIAFVFDRALNRAPAVYRNLLWAVAILVASVLPFIAFFDRVAPNAGTAAARARTGAPVSTATSAPGDAWTWIGAQLPHEGLAAQIGGSVTRLVVVLLVLVVAWRAFRLVQAFRRTAAIRKSALRDEGPEHDAVSRCRASMAMHDAEVRYSELVGAPATVGVFRPAVILPTSMRSPEFEVDLVASVAHEMAHIRRRDYLVNLLAEVVTLPICWHPATAYLKRMARASCEMACDELATRSLLRPAEYALSLVRIAESLTLDRRVGHTLGILDADILEERVMKLVDRRPRRSATSAVLIVVVAALVLGVSGVAAAAMGLRVQDAKSAPIDEYIVGTWIVSATKDGDDPAKRSPEADAMMKPTLTITIENGALVGSVVFPKVMKDPAGNPSVISRDAVPVKEPVYRNETFTFSVNNGEEFLIGELKRTENGFEGRWISSKSKLSGTLAMKRAE